MKNISIALILLAFLLSGCGRSSEKWIESTTCEAKGWTVRYGCQSGETVIGRISDIMDILYCCK